MSISMDGKSVGSITVPSTGDYKTFQDASTKVTLAAGKHIMRVTVTKEYFDIDYLNIVEGSVEPPPASSASTTPASSASTTPASSASTTPASSASTTPASSASTTPVAESSSGTDAIGQSLQLEFDTRQDFDIFDMQGQFMGRLSGYSFDEAIYTVQNGSVKFAKGVYYIRNRGTGTMLNFRIVK